MFFFLKHASENAALSTKQSSILKSHYSTCLTTEALSFCELECIKRKENQKPFHELCFFLAVTLKTLLSYVLWIKLLCFFQINIQCWCVNKLEKH